MLLLFYTDSIAFPRPPNQAPEDTWPFLLQQLIEAENSVRVYPYLRGLGGATIDQVRKIFERDLSYFSHTAKDTECVVLFNIGIVDSAPRPFTYHLKKLAGIPVLGPVIWHFLAPILHRHRTLLQRLSSFRLTSPRKFRELFDDMVAKAAKISDLVISIDTPLTPESLELRSPGLRSSITAYNAIKSQFKAVRHLDMSWVKEEHYLECGHHLSTEGHSVLANRLYQEIEGFRRENNR